MIEENSMLFLGDVIPYKAFNFTNNLKTVINLECPITRKRKPISGKVILSVPENHLVRTFGQNLLAVNLGNNHILDYGLAGLFDTLQVIHDSSTDYFGINFPGNDSHNPLIVDFRGMKIAFMSIVMDSTLPLVEFDDFNYLTTQDNCEIKKKINSVKRKVDRLVLYLHWGTADSSYPSKENISEAREFIDSGADIIIGTHAHAPQAVEKYKHGIIAYNIGNFIMPAFTNTPSFFDEDGNPMSAFTKRLMLWNRISWGIVIDMETMEHSVKKYIFYANRIKEVRSTPMDKYLDLHPAAMEDKYSRMVQKHIRTRNLLRRMREAITVGFCF